MMSIDILLHHISMGESIKAHKSGYFISPSTYREMEQALKHYLKTGELVEGKYGLDIAVKQNERVPLGINTK